MKILLVVLLLIPNINWSQELKSSKDILSLSKEELLKHMEEELEKSKIESNQSQTNTVSNKNKATFKELDIKIQKKIAECYIDNLKDNMTNQAITALIYSCKLLSLPND